MNKPGSSLRPGRVNALDDDALPVQARPDVVTCSLDTSIRRAAIIMSQRNVGSIIITDELQRPLGIITDTDIRRKVVGGSAQPDMPVHAIMSSPVVTIPVGSTIAGTILTMMRRNSRHLVVTGDGTPHTKVTGIISEHDLLLVHGNSPAVLAEEVNRTDDVKQLAAIRNKAEHLAVEFIRHGTSLRFVSAMITEINDAMLARLIAQAQGMLQASGVGDPGLDFCWLTCGSDGRKEQYLRTDQDTALIYEDPPDDRAEKAAVYFQWLAAEVTRGLTSCGFAPCSGGNMASNPHWCQPRSVWETYVHDWIRVPNEQALLNAAVFFDFRAAYGSAALAGNLRDQITREFGRDRTGLILLAKNALRAPSPTGLRKRLDLERHGAHKGRFDLKLRAIKPFTDAVRLLALDRGLHATGTLDRLAALSETDASVRDLSPDLFSAYETLIRCRVLFGAQGEERGRFIDPAALNRVETKRLLDAFDAVKALLTVVRVRYQLDALGLF
jgi:CBS domain-containing protein